MKASLSVCAAVCSVLAWGAASRASEGDALLLSASVGERGLGGRPEGVVLEESPATVAAFLRGVRELPDSPVGEPQWRFDVLRSGVRVNSFLLSERESRLLGAEVDTLVRRAARPGQYLYRIELPVSYQERKAEVIRQLEAAGLRSFRPAADQKYRYAFELTSTARQAPGGALPAVASAPPASAAPIPEEVQRRIRLLLQPRALDSAEDALFLRLQDELAADYRALQAEPGLRELDVQYFRQRWLTGHYTLRNLSVNARYSVNSDEELGIVERHFASRGQRGRSERPGRVVLQVIARDPDVAQVRAQALRVVPDLAEVRPGR
jgi:hypothetical protein